MSLFRYTNEEYDNLFLRIPDGGGEIIMSMLTQVGFYMYYRYVNQTGRIYTETDFRTMLRFLFDYFNILPTDTDVIICTDANNNETDLNEIVQLFFSKWMHLNIYLKLFKLSFNL